MYSGFLKSGFWDEAEFWILGISEPTQTPNPEPRIPVFLRFYFLFSILYSLFSAFVHITILPYYLIIPGQTHRSVPTFDP